MTISSKLLLFSALAIALAGCGNGVQPQTFLGERSARSAIIGLAAFHGGLKNPRPDHRRSWMAPNAKWNDLLYISDEGTNDVYVYSWPRGRLVGTLTGFEYPQGECVDKAGNVFITDFGATEILEYAHGGKRPIATLNDAGFYPSGCSIDPITGNLAVTNFGFINGGPGDVAIYENAQGSPKSYREPYVNYFYCSYDNHGNLYVDHSSNGGYEYAVLPKVKTTFTDLALNQTIETVGGLQWDGTYLAVGDTSQNVIYQFALNRRRTKGTEVGSSPLDGGSYVLQFWIASSKVVGPNAGTSNVMFWNYPSGGSPAKTLDGFDDPVGSAVSDAQ